MSLSLNKPSKELLTKIVNVELICFDFDGVFTDNIVYTDQNGIESVASWRGDGLGISKLKSIDLPVCVVSTEENPVTKRRCEKLNINCWSGVVDKAKQINKIAQDLSIPLENIAFVGNDINDLGCLKIVGVPIVVSDAYKEVKQIAMYITNAPGGRGAVREICDLIYAVKTDSEWSKS